MNSIPVKVNTVTFNAYPRPFWYSVNIGQWEPHTFTTFDRCLDKDHSMIDIGAWIGPTTLYAANLAKHVYAFEPDPVAFDELKYNVAANRGLENKIDLYPVCISDKCEATTLGTHSMFGDSMSSLLFKDSINAVPIKCITLQKFFEVHAIADCNFVKMDIEGGETIVLPHIVDFLIKKKITLFVSMHPFWFKSLGADVNDILEALDKFSSLKNFIGEPFPMNAISKLLMAKQGIDVLCGPNSKPTLDAI